MENEQYYVFDPNNPIANKPIKIKRNKGPILGFILIAIAILLIIGLVIVAYFIKIWPFSGSNPMSLLSEAMNKLQTIESLTYDFSVNLKSAVKDANSKPFIFVDSAYDALLPIYQRDNVRLLNIEDIISQIEYYKSQKKTYPKKLVDAEIALQDPNGQVYQYLSNGKTFSLTVIFETEGAINQVSKYGTVKEKTVVFNEKTPLLYNIQTINPPKPFLVFGYEKLIESIDNMPGTLSITGNISGSIQKNNAGTLKVGANINYEDLILNIEGESLVKDKDIYLKLNAFPGLPFINLSSIKEKWIKVSQDDLKNPSSYEFVPEEISDQQKEISSSQEQSKIIGSIAKEEGIIQLVGRPIKETLDGIKVYHYQFKLDKTKLASFYSKVTTTLNEKFQDNAVLKFNQEIFDSLSSQSTLAFIDYLNQQYSLDIYICRNTGYLTKASFSLTLVPSAESMNQNLAVLSWNLNLSNINQAVNISAPKESISIHDAYLLILGMSEEEYLLQKQSSNISSIRYALTTFKNLAGFYPNSLDQLKLTRGEIKKNSGIITESSIDTFALLSDVPQDVFTKQAYGYEKTADDNYKLTYQIVIPAYQLGKKLSTLIYSANSPILKYVSGSNTSDKMNLSLEVKTLGKIDSDKDGLSDSLEVYLGTDPKVKDTDKDGYSDGEELKMNYDPLTTGMLQ